MDFNFLTPMKLPNKIESERDCLIHIKHGNKQQQLNALNSPHSKSVHVFYGLNSKHEEVRNLAANKVLHQFKIHKIRKEANIPQLLESLIESALDNAEKKYKNKLTASKILEIHDKLSHKPHIDWVLNHYAKGDINDSDLDSIDNDLRLFKNHSGKFENRDINKYTPESLAKAVKEKNLIDSKVDATMVYKGELKGHPITIHKLNNFAAAVHHSKINQHNHLHGDLKKAKWCTSASIENFNNYSSNNDLYVINHGDKKYKGNYDYDTKEYTLRDEHNNQVADKEKINQYFTLLNVEDKIKSDDDYNIASKKGKIIKPSDLSDKYKSNDLHNIRDMIIKHGSCNIDPSSKYFHVYSKIKNRTPEDSIIDHLAKSYNTTDQKLVHSLKLKPSQFKKIFNALKNDSDKIKLMEYNNKNVLTTLSDTYNNSNHTVKNYLENKFIHNVLNNDDIDIPSNRLVNIFNSSNDDIDLLDVYNNKKPTLDSDTISKLANSIVSKKSHNNIEKITHYALSDKHLFNAIVNNLDDFDKFDKHDKVELANKLMPLSGKNEKLDNFLYKNTSNIHLNKSFFKKAVLESKTIPSNLHLSDLIEHYKNTEIEPKMYTHPNIMYHLSLNGDRENTEKVYQHNYKPLSYNEMNTLKIFHNNVKHDVNRNDIADKYSKVFPFLN